jgi:hypothetical protein
MCKKKIIVSKPAAVGAGQFSEIVLGPNINQAASGRIFRVATVTHSAIDVFADDTLCDEQPRPTDGVSGSKNT